MVGRGRGTDAIAELAQLPQWVCWEARPSATGDKPRKVPISARDGHEASTTDPRTWTTCEAAIAWTEAHPALAGIGFVFTADDPYTGVDLDGCRNAATGELAPWATQIVAELDSYTECSQSWTGLHIIVRASVPVGGNRRGSVELYDHGRYFAMTALPLPGMPATINARQAALETLHRDLFGIPELVVQPRPALARRTVEPDDAALLERMFRSPSGDRIRRLWDGDTARYGADDSAADFALCAHLRYWTGGDAVRADRLFRQSGLYRAKWDEKRGAQTYGARTLARTGSYQPIVRGGIAV